MIGLAITLRANKVATEFCEGLNKTNEEIMEIANKLLDYSIKHNVTFHDIEEKGKYKMFNLIGVKM